MFAMSSRVLLLKRATLSAQNASANEFGPRPADDVKSWREKEVSNPNTLQILCLSRCSESVDWMITITINFQQMWSSKEEYELC